MAKIWTMPKWMEAYREMIVNTGGNSIEDLMNGDDSPVVNLPLFVLQTAVKSQVQLLQNLHNAGLLNTARESFQKDVATAKGGR